MERELTPSESLKLIETMIDQAKRSFSRISFFFLLWGVLLIGAMLATYMLRNSGEAWGHGAAFGIAGALGGLISGIAGARMGASVHVANPMDRVVGWIWLAFIITLVLLIIATAGYGGGDPSVAITLLTGLPTFITGRIMRFKPLVLAASCFGWPAWSWPSATATW